MYCQKNVMICNNCQQELSGNFEAGNLLSGAGPARTPWLSTEYKPTNISVYKWCLEQLGAQSELAVLELPQAMAPLLYLLPLLPLLALAGGQNFNPRHQRSLVNTFPFNSQDHQQSHDHGHHRNHAGQHQGESRRPSSTLESRGSKQVR